MWDIIVLSNQCCNRIKTLDTALMVSNGSQYSFIEININFLCSLSIFFCEYFSIQLTGIYLDFHKSVQLVCNVLREPTLMHVLRLENIFSGS